MYVFCLYVEDIEKPESVHNLCFIDSVTTHSISKMKNISSTYPHIRLE